MLSTEGNINKINEEKGARKKNQKQSHWINQDRPRSGMEGRAWGQEQPGTAEAFAREK